MKKRYMQLFSVILLFALLVSSCKKSPGTPEDNPVTEETQEGEQEEPQKYVYGFSGMDMKNPFFITLEESIRSYVEEDGGELITLDPESDKELQAAQIDELIDDGIDAIFLTPVDWEAITPSLEKLKDADVKIINIDSEVKESDYVDAFIGSDNEKAGYLCGEDLAKRCPDGGNIIILESHTQNSIMARITGFEQALSDNGAAFEIIGRADTDGEFNLALTNITELLEEHSDQQIDAVMCGNDQLAVAALTAFNVNGMTDVLIYGIDGSPDIKKELKKVGTQVAGTVAQSPINMGKDAYETALKILSGEDYEKKQLEDVFMIDVDNIDMYGVDGWQ